MGLQPPRDRPLARATGIRMCHPSPCVFAALPPLGSAGELQPTGAPNVRGPPPSAERGLYYYNTHLGGLNAVTNCKVYRTLTYNCSTMPGTPLGAVAPAGGGAKISSMAPPWDTFGADSGALPRWRSGLADHLLGRQRNRMGTGLEGGPRVRALS